MSVWGMIHDTAALFIIACLALPFTGLTFRKLGSEAAAKRAGTVAKLLRIPQFVLIVSLITGIVRYGLHFSTWLLVVLIIFLAIAALMGILTKTAKTIKNQAEQNENFQPSVAKFVRLSIFLAIAIIIMVIIKLT